MLNGICVLIEVKRLKKKRFFMKILESCIESLFGGICIR